MKASTIINDEMTLEEKLTAIEQAMANAQAMHKDKNPDAAPIDPSDLTMCEGCQ